MSKKLVIIISIVAIVAIAGVVLGVVLLKDKPVEDDKVSSTEKVEENEKEDIKEVEKTLEQIMTEVYAGIPEENLPMALSNMEVNEENIEYYLGTADIEYAEALANESMVGSIAHSVVLVRLNDAKDTTAVVQKIKDNVDPRKWICIEASNVVVKSKGDLVILIMSNEELAPKLEANFDNL